ncbi:MAG: M14 family metallopeptidase [Pseudomonadota bacterium]|nr:M14 family metallopeptidase [Pseudomonadota bacterium]
MHIHTHPIASEEHIAAFQLTTFHFGTPGARPKVYIQASLHADEVPAMLVAHTLRGQLEQLDKEGKIPGEIILVPSANPIGLSQVVHGAPFGRFDLSTGVNFNRSYKHVADDLKQSLAGKLGADAAKNIALVREHALASLAAWVPKDNTSELKKLLLTMAIDADIVFDLHCDNEAVLHLYCGTPLAEQVQPLSALMGAYALLVARESGGDPFDEACSRLWWDLSAHFGPSVALPPSCMAITVELRGEMDVTYALAQKDSDALLQFMARNGAVDIPVLPLPEALSQPTPLEGVQPIAAPHSGVLVFLKKLGETVVAGDAIADLVNPVSGTVTTLRAEHPGVLFASTAHRHLLRGMNVCKIASAEGLRTGNLLGA